MRYTLNDIQGTSLLINWGIIDLEDESYSLRVEAERRIGDALKVELEGRWFTNVRESSLTSAFKNDDDVALLRLSQYF